MPRPPLASLARHHLTMAYNNMWANHRLLRAACALTDAELAAPGTSFFPSIKATLNHNVTVDWLYVDALERAFDGRPHNPSPGAFFEPEEPFSSGGALRDEQLAVDRRLVAVCLALDDARLETPVGILRGGGDAPERLVHETAHRILSHLSQHQIHHRGQAHAMLAGTRIAPPQLDEFFCADEAHLRAADLAELGLSEARIWGA